MGKTNVKVIAEDEEVVLAQWHDGAAQRAYVPAAEVRKGRAPADVLDAGIPYGAPWEEILEALLNEAGISAETLAASLRRHNIWTAKDIEQNARAARKALNAVLLGVVNVGNLLRETRSIEKRAGG